MFDHSLASPLVEFADRFREVVPVDPLGDKIGVDIEFGVLLEDENPRDGEVGPVSVTMKTSPW